MLGGNISRAPDFKMDYFARIPYFDALLRVEEGQPLPPEATEQAAAQATDLMALYNVGYVLLHPPIEQRYPYVDTWQASWDFVKATLPLEPTPFWTGDGIEAYRVDPARSGRHLPPGPGHPRHLRLSGRGLGRRRGGRALLRHGCLGHGAGEPSLFTFGQHQPLRRLSGDRPCSPLRLWGPDPVHCLDGERHGVEQSAVNG